MQRPQKTQNLAMVVVVESVVAEEWVVVDLVAVVVVEWVVGLAKLLLHLVPPVQAEFQHHQADRIFNMVFNIFENVLKLQI